MSAEPIRVEVMPNTEEWYEERKSSLGASDAPAALGFSRWRKPIEVCMDKWGEREREEENENMRRGHVMEPFIGEAYSKTTGIQYAPSVLVRSAAHPFMHATPDGLIREDGILQIKTASVWNMDEWGDLDTDPIPTIYDIQVRHEMAVLDRDWCDVAVCFADQDVWRLLVHMADNGVSSSVIVGFVMNELPFRIYHVVRDLEVEKNLIRAESEFWNNYVLPHIEPPDFDNMVDSGNVREVSGDDAKQIKIAKKHWLAQARATDRLEKKKGVIKQLIGEDGGIVDVDTGDKVTWKRSKDSEKVDWEGVAKAVLADKEVSSEEFEQYIKEHTELRPGQRRFMWPTAKWKKEMK